MLTLPGFVDAHCHAFQRALRGRARRDFWAWRDEMIALAGSLSLSEIRSEHLEVYRELRLNATPRSGSSTISAVTRRSQRQRRPPRLDRLRLPLRLLSARRHPRFRQESVTAYLRELETLRDAGIPVGVAHSVRACPAEALRELGRYAAEHELPLHVHATNSRARSTSASPSTDCVRSSCSPAQGCLSPRSTIVHATHANGGELDLIRDAGRASASPDDGGVPRRRVPAVARVCHRAIGMCIGSDSNVRIDPLEELRELEGIARRQTGKRGVIVGCPACFGATRRAALGLETWPDEVVDLEHLQLRGVDEARSTRRWS